MLPKKLGNLISLNYLSVKRAAIKELPHSIAHLNGLAEMFLGGCENLETLPSGICNLISLRHLDLSNCSRLKMLPKKLGNLISLKYLSVKRAAIKELPHSIAHLYGLEELYLRGCENLETPPSGICNLTSLRHLDLSDCSRLEILPEKLGNLKSLKYLSAERAAIKELPHSIAHLNGLAELLEILKLGSLKSLEDISAVRIAISQLPSSLERLQELKKLSCPGRSSIKFQKTSDRIVKGFAVCAVIAFEKYLFNGDSQHKLGIHFDGTYSDGDQSSPTNIMSATAYVASRNRTLIDSDHVAFGYCDASYHYLDTGFGNAAGTSSRFYEEEMEQHPKENENLQTVKYAEPIEHIGETTGMSQLNIFHLCLIEHVGLLFIHHICSGLSHLPVNIFSCRSYKAEVDNKETQDKRRKTGDLVNFGKVPSKIGHVDYLDDDGFPYIGANLQSGDIVIGKCTESADHNIKLKHTEQGMVQKVVLSSNDDGKNFAVVSLRQIKSATVSLVSTICIHMNIFDPQLLETRSQGIVPDVVINPYAFPSRQTPDQLLEAGLGKGIACGGLKKYATPFSTPSFDAITEQLHRAGFQKVKWREFIMDVPVKWFSDSYSWVRHSTNVHVYRKCKNMASVIQRSVGNGRKVKGPYCCLCETEGDIVKMLIDETSCGFFQKPVVQLSVSSIRPTYGCLCRGKLPMPLSVDHKPDREDECARIEAAGGNVIRWNDSRVFGALAMSRSIGDKYLKPWIIPDPDDVMSNEEACDVARKRILIWHKKHGDNNSSPEGGEGVDPAAQAAADYLSKLAMHVTVIVVDLKAERKFKRKT
ncbi:hypothetical protein EZV62_007254 [Acer yangbiense]|uniref:DNA-directed RNA polymerase n=1 Tax=Acer yangbiense TaxID=1000413 RepID=A0A5C7IB71_9ROSI|nr:hypothetical protein EZV62_007254 [Acer yangbiense]